MKKSKLAILSREDQSRLLELCETHTYDQVVDLAAQPREQGGLELKTNRSALSRFYGSRGNLLAGSQLASQFLELLECQPIDIDDFIPQMTHLIGQSAFLLAARNRPFEEYRRPLEAFLRLERLSREREKIKEAREEQRRLFANRRADRCATPPPTDQPNPPQPSQSSQSSPAAPSDIASPGSAKLDFTLPDFKTPPAHQPDAQPAGFKLPGNAIPFSDFSLANPHHPANLTKSHLAHPR